MWFPPTSSLRCSRRRDMGSRNSRAHPRPTRRRHPRSTCPSNPTARLRPNSTRRNSHMGLRGSRTDRRRPRTHSRHRGHSPARRRHLPLHCSRRKRQRNWGRLRRRLPLWHHRARRRPSQHDLRCRALPLANSRRRRQPRPRRFPRGRRHPKYRRRTLSKCRDRRQPRPRLPPAHRRSRRRNVRNHQRPMPLPLSLYRWGRLKRNAWRPSNRRLCRMPRRRRSPTLRSPTPHSRRSRTRPRLSTRSGRQCPTRRPSLRRIAARRLLVPLFSTSRPRLQATTRSRSRSRPTSRDMGRRPRRFARDSARTWTAALSFSCRRTTRQASFARSASA
eukprot:Opistho-1_new@31885